MHEIVEVRNTVEIRNQFFYSYSACVSLSSDDAAAVEFAFDEVVYLQLVFSKKTIFYGQLSVFRYQYRVSVPVCLFFHYITLPSRTVDPDPQP